MREHCKSNEAIFLWKINCQRFVLSFRGDNVLDTLWPHRVLRNISFQRHYCSLETLPILLHVFHRPVRHQKSSCYMTDYFTSKVGGNITKIINVFCAPWIGQFQKKWNEHDRWLLEELFSKHMHVPSAKSQNPFFCSCIIS